MNKYEVEVYRDVREACLVTVEADSEEDARSEAMELSHSLPDAEWRRGHVTEMGTFDCTKIGEA